MNKKTFPGKTLGEKIKTEFLDLTIKAEFRKEFWIMAAYATLLFAVTIFAYYKNIMPGNDRRGIYLFVLLGAYWMVSDFTKRKKLFTQNIRYVIDSVVYVFLMYKIVLFTGGHDSPVRFPLFFLTAISAPLYGNMLGVILLLTAVAGIQLYFNYSRLGLSYELMFASIEAFTFIAAAIFIKISIITIQKKIEAEDLLNMELAGKLEETTVAMENIKAKNDEVEKLTKELTKQKKLKK